jgi:TonB family protein
MRMNLETVLEQRKKEDISPFRSVLLSLFVHIGMIVLIYFGAKWFASQPQFSQFISASLVPAKGLPTFSPSARSAVARSETSSKTSISGKKVDKETVKLPSLTKPKTDKKRIDKGSTDDKKRSGVTKDKEDRRSSDRGEEGRYGLPGGSDSGVGAKPGTISSIDLSDFEYTWYSASVADILSKNWVRSIAPPEMRGVRVTARFRINVDGTVEDIYLIKKSNIFALDQEVIRAIKNSSPLPPLPKGFKEKKLVAQYEFIY